MPIRLSQDEFEDLVQQALDSLPKEFEPYMENIVVEIQPRPSREELKSLRLHGGGTLLGLYTGVPMTEKSVSQPFEYPERILIFKNNIEDFCGSKEEVVQQVRTTVLHEVGHHFGMDEGDLDRLGYG